MVNSTNQPESSAYARPYHHVNIEVGARLPLLFDQSPEEFVEQYNLLGYDNGDGELACSIIKYKNHEFTAVPLSFSKTSFLKHIPNILAFDQNGKAVLVDNDHINGSGRIYCNFKRCPGSETDLKYAPDDDKTYAQLMAHSFACALERLIECNDNKSSDSYFDPHKPTVIMVGRPSSEGWAAAEKDYSCILASCLKYYLPENAKSFSILVLSESLAAMAGALKLDQDKWLNTFVQILDLGSSTFDLTTVTPYGLPSKGEGSFQFGGNQLDRALAVYGDYTFYAEYSEKEGYSIAPDHRKIAGLRFKKESCYGDNGKDLDIPKSQNSYIYSVYKDGVPYLNRMKLPVRYTIDVSREFLEKVTSNEDDLEGLYCSAKQLTVNPFHTDSTHKSWLAACKYVFEQFYEQTKNLLPEDESITKRLILTGGVSNMPEVRKLAEEVFHTKTSEITENPSQTVSDGLALILGYEVIRNSILAEIEEEFFEDGRFLPDVEPLWEELVREAAISDLDYYEKVIENWASGNVDKTLESCVLSIADPNNGIFDANDNFTARACENWYKKKNIDKWVENLLKEKFRRLFPKFTHGFHTAITMPDMSDMPSRELENSFRLNYYMFFDDGNCPENLNDKSRTFTPAERTEILAVYRKHREDLYTGGKFSFGGYTVQFEGIRDVYAQQLTVSGDAKPLHRRIFEMLKPKIWSFVESQTYYLAATRRM